eukprot:gene5819-236_t
MARNGEKTIPSTLQDYRLSVSSLKIALMLLVAIVGGSFAFALFMSLPKAESPVTIASREDLITPCSSCPCPPCPVCPFTAMDLPVGKDKPNGDKGALLNLKHSNTNQGGIEHKITSKVEGGCDGNNGVSLDILKGPAMDRAFEDTVTVSMHYTLDINSKHWIPQNVSYNQAMTALHGENIWEDPRTQAMMQILDIRPDENEIFGSMLNNKIVKYLIDEIQPRMLVEVGVFRGATSINMAQLLESSPKLKDSFIVSIDTWLLDLRFVWSSPEKRQSTILSKGLAGRYFKNAYVAGASHMYYIFLSNVLLKQMQHRIIPLQTTSSNGAMALIAHRFRPDLIYVDASHANPDVLVDLESYYQVLAPDGALAVDDYDVGAVRYAVEALVRKHDLDLKVVGKQAYIIKHSS